MTEVNIRLDADLLALAKRAAAERGTTLDVLIEDALRRALAPAAAAKRVRAPLPTFSGDGLQPGVEPDDTAGLLDVMDVRDARA